MNQLTQWLAMGGYADYVWSAYGLVCLVLALNYFGIKWQQRRTRQKLQQWFKKGR